MTDKVDLPAWYGGFFTDAATLGKLLTSTSASCVCSAGNRGFAQVAGVVIFKSTPNRQSCRGLPFQNHTPNVYIDL